MARERYDKEKEENRISGISLSLLFSSRKKIQIPRRRRRETRWKEKREEETTACWQKEQKTRSKEEMRTERGEKEKEREKEEEVSWACNQMSASSETWLWEEQWKSLERRGGKKSILFFSFFHEKGEQKAEEKRRVEREVGEVRLRSFCFSFSSSCHSYTSLRAYNVEYLRENPCLDMINFLAT